MKFYEDAFIGSLVADALAMPVHWYYDRAALQRDYGEIKGYLQPKNPHADSILWRSQYQPLNDQAEILHDQAQYWGQRGIHYHQFLADGENTLNYQLAIELYRQVKSAKGYDAKAWLERYMLCLRTPHWHRDTYLEEYHRAFFNRLASGIPPHQCGIADEHIGGLAQVPALLAALNPETDLMTRRGVVREHVSLTHRQPEVLNAADALTRLLDALARGATLHVALMQEAGDFSPPVKPRSGRHCATKLWLAPRSAQPATLKMRCVPHFIWLGSITKISPPESSRMPKSAVIIVTAEPWWVPCWERLWACRSLGVRACFTKEDNGDENSLFV